MKLQLMWPSARVPAGLPWLMLVLFAGIGCDKESSRRSKDLSAVRPPIRGEPIVSVAATSSVLSSSAVVRSSDRPLLTNAPAFSGSSPAGVTELRRDGFLPLGWDRLSGFKFDVYEFYSETNTGRALLKSDDTIPHDVKAYDGRRVVVSGFVLPLRIRKQLVTEFLLLRDQGTCCFGTQAKINHFMRVKLPGGFRHEGAGPVVVSGTLRVGEIYIQGYLTGIYQMDAEQIESADRAMN